MISHISQGIQQNLYFLIVEVSSQLAAVRDHIKHDTPSAAKQILDRSGYIHNLRGRVHDGCLELLTHSNHLDPTLIRSIETVANELSQIARQTREAVHQISRMDKRAPRKHKPYLALIRNIEAGIGLIEEALHEHNATTALAIGDCKQQIDHHYENLLDNYHRKLSHSKQPGSLVAALFIAHSLKQMGDSLLNISEALISAQLGLPLNSARYHSLQATMDHLNDRPLDELEIEPIAETRSGSGISTIRENGCAEDDYIAIYKDGSKQKLKEERQGVESWHQIYPGIAPRIIAYHKHGHSASMLIEHFSGTTLEQLLLHGSD